jgi:hypothetical protein
VPCRPPEALTTTFPSSSRTTSSTSPKIIYSQVVDQFVAIIGIC